MSDGTVSIAVDVNGKEIEELNNQLDELDGKSSTASGGIKQMVGAMGIVKVASAAFSFAAGAVKELGGEAIASSDSIDKFQSTMKFGGYGEKEIASATKQVKKYADDTVYELSDVSSTTAQLASNGIKDYMGLTKAAGNLNAVAGGNKETFKSVGMVLTQTAGAGKLTTENWNQLADAIPGASGKLQEAMKKNGAFTGNFREAMEKGEISADEFNKAIMDLGMTDAAKEAATSTKTFEGAFGALQANVVSGIQDTINAIGKGNLVGIINGFSGLVTKAFEALVKKVGEAKEVFKDISAFVKEHATAFKILAGVLISVVAGFVAFQTTIGIMNGVSKAIKGVRTAFTLMKAAMIANPFALVIAGIAALAAAFIYFYKTNEGFRERINAIGKSLSSLLAPFDKVREGLNLLWQGFKAIFNFDLSTNVAEIKKQFTSMFPESLWNALTKVALTLRILKYNISDLLKSGINKVGDFFNSLTGSLGNSIGKIDGFGIAFKVIKSIFLSLLGPIGLVIKAFELFAKVIGGGDISKGMDTIFSSIQSLADGISKYGPQLGTSFGTALQGILGAIASALPGIISGGLQVISGFIVGVAQGLPMLALAAVQLIGAFTSTMVLLIPTIAASGLMILTALTNAVVAGIAVISTCVTRIIVAFITALTVHLPQIIFAGVGLINSLIQGITQAIPSLVLNGANLIVTWLTALTQHLPEIIVAGMNLLIALLQGIASRIGDLTNSAISVVVNFAKAIAARMGDIINVAVDLMINFLNGLSSRMPDIIEAGVTLIASVLEGLGNNLYRIIDAGTDLVVKCIEGISNNLYKLTDAAADLVDELVESIISYSDRMWKAAIRLINGLADGIDNNKDAARGAVERLVDSLGSAIFGDELWDAGSALMDGLLDGIKWGFETVKDFVSGIADTIADLKGPLPYDKKVLIENGSALMLGLKKGIVSGFEEIEALSSEMANAISGKFELQGNFSGYNFATPETALGTGRMGLASVGGQIINNSSESKSYAPNFNFNIEHADLSSDQSIEETSEKLARLTERQTRGRL